MKQKSHSGAKKRVTKTGTGKLKMRKSSVQHRLTSKSKGQKKLHRGGKPVSSADKKSISRLLPHI